MKYLLALASLALCYAFDISSTANRCSCSNVNYQSDCVSLSNCQWSGTACTSTNCTSLTMYSDCVAASLCAWVNNTCATFTKCSDYSATANSTCYVQGAGCNYTNTANATSPCTDYTTTSTTTTTTTTTTVAACSTYTTNATCLGTGIGCVWSGTACKIFGCSDFTSSATCTRVYSEDYKTMKICGWSTACAESSSLSVLTSSNCFSLTSGRATWNAGSSVCQQCSSSSFILLISLLSALLI